jgi:glyoxylate reductase
VIAKLESAATVDVWMEEAPMPPAQLRSRAADKDGIVALLTDSVDREVIEAARGLKVIANVAVGHDNVDVAYARSRGVIVTNTPDVLTDSVAEFTWALILGLTRRVGEGERLVRSRRWKGWALDFMLGTELAGRQLGIVGLGRIGSAVAARAPAFRMRVAYTSKDDRVPVAPDAGSRGGAAPARWRGSAPPRRSSSAGAMAGIAEDWQQMPLDRLLSTSDVVSLHVPLTPETRHLIDERALTRMKRSAYLVNTARGAIIDEAALAWALQQHLLAGAALDVYEHEPAVDPGLFQLENVLLAPHLGSATTETRTAMADLAAENVLAVLAGRPPLTPVP